MAEIQDDGKDCPINALIIEVWKHRDTRDVHTEIAICQGSIRQKLERKSFRWGEQHAITWETTTFWPNTIGIKTITLMFVPLGEDRKVHVTPMVSYHVSTYDRNITLQGAEFSLVDDAADVTLMWQIPKDVVTEKEIEALFTEPERQLPDVQEAFSTHQMDNPQTFDVNGLVLKHMPLHPFVCMHRELPQTKTVKCRVDSVCGKYKVSMLIEYFHPEGSEPVIIRVNHMSDITSLKNGSILLSGEVEFSGEAVQVGLKAHLLLNRARPQRMKLQTLIGHHRAEDVAPEKKLCCVCAESGSVMKRGVDGIYTCGRTCSKAYSMTHKVHTEVTKAKEQLQSSMMDMSKFGVKCKRVDGEAWNLPEAYVGKNFMEEDKKEAEEIELNEVVKCERCTPAKPEEKLQVLIGDDRAEDVAPEKKLCCVCGTSEYVMQMWCNCETGYMCMRNCKAVHLKDCVKCREQIKKSTDIVNAAATYLEAKDRKERVEEIELKEVDPNGVLCERCTQAFVVYGDTMCKQCRLITPKPTETVDFKADNRTIAAYAESEDDEPMDKVALEKALDDCGIFDEEGNNKFMSSSDGQRAMLLALKDERNISDEVTLGMLNKAAIIPFPVLGNDKPDTMRLCFAANSEDSKVNNFIYVFDDKSRFALPLAGTNYKSIVIDAGLLNLVRKDIYEAARIEVRAMKGDCHGNFKACILKMAQEDRKKGHLPFRRPIEVYNPDRDHICTGEDCAICRRFIKIRRGSQMPGLLGMFATPDDDSSEGPPPLEDTPVITQCDEDEDKTFRVRADAIALATYGKRRSEDDDDSSEGSPPPLAEDPRIMADIKRRARHILIAWANEQKANEQKAKKPPSVVTRSMLNSLNFLEFNQDDIVFKNGVSYVKKGTVLADMLKEQGMPPSSDKGKKEEMTLGAKYHKQVAEEYREIHIERDSILYLYYPNDVVPVDFWEHAALGPLGDLEFIQFKDHSTFHPPVGYTACAPKDISKGASNVFVLLKDTDFGKTKISDAQRDVALVMSQTDCSADSAMSALTLHCGDIVAACKDVKSRYRSNPYFDGVISAITTQGEVTTNVRADRWEIEEYQAQAQAGTLFIHPVTKEEAVFSTPKNVAEKLMEVSLKHGVTVIPVSFSREAYDRMVEEQESLGRLIVDQEQKRGYDAQMSLIYLQRDYNKVSIWLEVNSFDCPACKTRQPNDHSCSIEKLENMDMEDSSEGPPELVEKSRPHTSLELLNRDATKASIDKGEIMSNSDILKKWEFDNDCTGTTPDGPGEKMSSRTKYTREELLEVRDSLPGCRVIYRDTDGIFAQIPIGKVESYGFVCEDKHIIIHVLDVNKGSDGHYELRMAQQEELAQLKSMRDTISKSLPSDIQDGNSHIVHSMIGDHRIVCARIIALAKKMDKH